MRGRQSGWVKWAFLGAGVLVALFAILAGIGAVFGSGDDSNVVAVRGMDTRAARTQAPTLTAGEAHYIASVATAAAEATRTIRESDLKTRNAAPTKTPVPPPYRLALVSASCRSESSFIICEGFVKNLTSSPIDDVEAVVSILDGNQVPFSSDSALVDYQPILPGQTSPFQIYATYNPAFEYWTINFKEFFGTTILTRDDR